MKKICSLIIILCFSLNVFALPLEAAAETNIDFSSAAKAGTQALILTSMLNLPMETIGNLFRDLNSSKISKSQTENKKNSQKENASKNSSSFLTQNTLKLNESEKKSQILTSILLNKTLLNKQNLELCSNNILYLSDNPETLYVIKAFRCLMALLPKSDANAILISYVFKKPILMKYRDGFFNC
jgi:hypothetical protein